MKILLLLETAELYRLSSVLGNVFNCKPFLRSPLMWRNITIRRVSRVDLLQLLQNNLRHCRNLNLSRYSYLRDDLLPLSRLRCKKDIVHMLFIQFLALGNHLFERELCYSLSRIPLPGLTSINVARTTISNLEFVKYTPNLTRLDISWTYVTDLAPLSMVTKLQELYMRELVLNRYVTVVEFIANPPTNVSHILDVRGECLSAADVRYISDTTLVTAECTFSALFRPYWEGPELFESIETLRRRCPHTNWNIIYR